MVAPSGAASAPRLVGDVLAARARVQPDATALVVDGRGDVTFRRWDQRSNAFARGLMARGVRPGERFALLFDNAGWIDFAVAYFGCMKAGAVAVPLPAGLAAAQVHGIIDHCEASGLCTPPTLVPGAVAYSVWDPADVEGGQRDEALAASAGPDDLAQILYTSGTTALPKAVACSHANLLFGIVATGPDLDRARQTRVAVHAFPVGVNAAQWVLLRAAHRLATTVTMPAFEPERYAALVASHGATVAFLVPAMAVLLVSTGAFDRHDASSLEAVSLTGAPTPPALLRKLDAALPHARVFNDYALTEAVPAGVSTVYDPSRPGSVGRAEDGTVIRVVGDGGEDCRPLDVGEVWLSSPGAPVRSYYRQPAASAAVFVDGWVRTGDLGYLDEAGYLFLVDRRADLISSGARKISTLEVEAVLHEHPAVNEAAVFGIAHEVLGEVAAAAVALRAPATTGDLTSFCAARLAAYAVPRTVLVVDRLPRGISGKVLKTELRARVAADRSREVVAPRTPTEEAMAEIWGRVLGVATVGVEDRFIDLGGQSVGAVRVVAEVERRWGVRPEEDAVYEADTVALVASWVDATLLAGAVERRA